MAAVKGSSRGPSRKEQAAATAARIVACAHTLFVERGYTGTRMADVADAADVAVQTVYFRFHTKGELLQACYERAVLGPDDPRVPMEQPEIAAMFTASTGAQALRHFAVGNTAICVRVGLLDDVTRSAAHEPDAVAVRRNSEALRRTGYTRMVEHLDRQFGLRSGLSVERAVDLLLAFGGTGMYRSLVLDDGWPLDDYIDWLATTLAGQLLATPTGRRRRG